MQGTQKEAITLLAAELQSTATRTSSARKVQHKGMLLTLVIANEAGTTTFTPVLQSKDNEGNWHAIWTAAAAVAADGTTTYLIYPGTRVVEDFTEYVDIELPAEWRCVLTYAGTPATDKMDTLLVADLLV